MITGAFTFVLHSHIPYTRQAGRWPHGEEWIHEATAESYIPLLDALNDLHSKGIPARLTLTLTPAWIDRLRALTPQGVAENFGDSLDRRQQRALLERRDVILRDAGVAQ